MIKVTCPCCQRVIGVEGYDNSVAFNLQRLGRSLCICAYCESLLLVFYNSNGIINAIRVSRRR